MESPWPTDAALGRASSASTDAIPPDRQMFDACIARERPAECCSPAPLPPDPPLLPGNTANLPVGSVPAGGTDGVIQTQQGRAGKQRALLLCPCGSLAKPEEGPWHWRLCCLPLQQLRE